MADKEYDTKLESLKRYIPFLINMMSELKSKGNREAQLTKIQSLHDMITDSRKKLKIETLNRCEEVLTNIYYKVNPQMKTKGLSNESTTLPGIESPRSTPASPSPTRDIFVTKPVTIPTEKINTPSTGFGSHSAKKSHLPKVDVYSNVVINSSKSTTPIIAAKVPDMSKPPISLDDLKTLEDDVHQKISDAKFANASVDDLQAVRKELELQLRVDSVTATMSPEKSSKEPINTTVRNNPSLSKKHSFTESKSKVQESPKATKTPTSPTKETKTSTCDKSLNDKESITSKVSKELTPNKSPQKVLKESSSIFGSLLSSIDNKILEEKKKTKKNDRRSSLSKEDSGSSTSLSSEKYGTKDVEAKNKPTEDKSKESKHKDKDGSHKHRRSSVDKEKHKHKEKSDNRTDGEKNKKNKKKDKKEKHKSKDHKDGHKSSKKDSSKSEDKSTKDSSKDEEKSLKSDQNSEVKKNSKFVLLSDILLSRSKLGPNKNINSVPKEESSSSASSNLDCDKNTNIPNTSSDASKDSISNTSLNAAKDNKSDTTSTAFNQKTSPIYKRLADKYNPKPKSKTSEVEIPDVDKAVSDSIENLMKISPAKSLLSPLGDAKPSEKVSEPTFSQSSTSVSVTEPSKTVQLPDILQRIFSKPLLGDIIPKRLNENMFPLTAAAMTKPGAIQPPEPPILSPPHRPLTFEPPDVPRNFSNFLSPTHRQDFIPNHDMGARPNALLPTPGLQHGILPTPPMPTNLRGFSDHNPMMDMGFGNSLGTPRMDFDTPSTPMPDFGSPRVDFEHPIHLRNEQFNSNQRFMPQMHQERQIHCFDPRNQNFMGQAQFQPQPEVNVFNNQLGPGMGFYGQNNQMPLLNEVPLYMQDQNFFQERAWHENARWGRRPGDPRSYREYKEMKERQEREFKASQEKQKEIKDPRLAPRDSQDGATEKDAVVRDPRLFRDNVDRSADDKSEVTRDPRLSRGTEKSIDRERDLDKSVNRDNRDVRSRDYGPKSREKEPRDRARSRDRAMSRLRDTSDSRNSRSRPRERENRFDKMYSTNRAQSRSQSRTLDDKSEDDDSFVSPLDSLYNAGEKGKTGRGYGVQKFKIPRKSKIEDAKSVNEKRDERRSSSVNRKKRYIERSDSSDDSDPNEADNNPVPENDSDIEIIEDDKFEKLKDASIKSKKLNTEEVKDIKKVDEKSEGPVFDTSRIKVIIKTEQRDKNQSELNTWENDTLDASADDSDLSNFISEYDRELQLENKDNLSDVSKPTKYAMDTIRQDAQTKVSDVQMEEPSSSQDATAAAKKSSSKVTGAVGKITDQSVVAAESVEADSSKRSDGTLTPQECVSKSDEPSEQNILAHFFENLLKSRNKKDKKTALFSLIETFSDSFDTKEIQKIRKIIRADEDEEEESDEEEKESRSSSGKKYNTKNVTSDITHSSAVAPIQEEQPVVGSTTEEVPLDNNEAKSDEISSTKESLKVAETQVNEVTKSSEESEQPSIEQTNSEESLNQTEISELFLEPVIVSVGERIKNRRRNPTPSKSRKKVKTELDLLHEDIQDMFIRDGVLTATGKRMCRILKDDPTALSVANPETSLEQPKKMRKKPGPKPKPKINKDDIQNSMKDMRVVINKMPDNIINANTSTTRQLRSRTRLSSYAESDDDNLKVYNDVGPSHQLRSRSLQNSYAESDNESQKSNNYTDIGLLEEASVKSEVEGESLSESDDEDNKSQASDGTSKPRVVRRRRGAKWASGIIPKNKKKRAQNKSQDNSPATSRAPSPDANNSLVEPDFDKLVEPDREYYYDYNSKTKMTCKLCKYSGHLLTGHYLKEHPQSEVLCSRLAPEVASEAIKDFLLNGKKYESVISPRMTTKYHYCCRVCGFASTTSPIFFYEHVTTHTGEYRHQCGICEYFAVTGKTMAGHFLTAHPDQEKKAIRRTYTLAVVFGYICGECNFLQLKQKSVEDHANIFHLGEKPSIHKINMSTVLDPILDTLTETSKALEHKIIDLPVAENEALSGTSTGRDATETTPPAPKIRKKPGPKPKGSINVPKIFEKNKSSENFAPAVLKKPGPKSKTMVTEEDKTAEKIVKPISVISAEALTETPAATTIGKKPGPKSKTQIQKPAGVEQISTLDEPVKQFQKENAQAAGVSSTPVSIENADGSIKETSARKRRRSLDKLISEDSGDDLDTIITLFSRSSRAAKEKATAKLKTLMESNEGLSTRKKPDTDSTRKESDKGKSQSSEDVKEKDDHQDETEESRKEVEKEKDKPDAIPRETQAGEMNPPSLKGKSLEKDMNVFTCKTDILEEEEAKKIEEERLRKMEELNKSIGSRTSKLDFVDKLSSRLSNEQSNENSNVKVKQEPKDSFLTSIAAAPRAETPTMPVLEKELPTLLTKTPPITKVSKSPLVSKKPILEEDNSLPQSNISFRQNKPNSLFFNMIEKLQGKVNEAAVQHQDPNTSSQSVSEETCNVQRPKTPEVLISIGDLITATKSDSEIIYSCHANNCYVATKDKMVFQLHCKFGHKDLSASSSLCEKCGVVVEVTPDTSLLENLYDHLVFAHSDCLTKSSSLRMRRLSGDKLSVKQELSQKSSSKPSSKEKDAQDFEAGMDCHVLVYSSKESTVNTVTTHLSTESQPASTSKEASQESVPVLPNPVEKESIVPKSAPNRIPVDVETSNEDPLASETTLELAEDNPFSFKIENVVSLAKSSESDDQSSQSPPTQNKPKTQDLPPLKPVPPLTLIGIAKQQPSVQQNHLIVKEAKLTSAELSRPKKTPKALQKFVDSPGDLYKCPHFYCVFTTNARTFMERHLKMHKSGESMVPCVYCDMKTPWEHVPMHIDIRHANCRFVCNYCLYRACLKEYVCLHQEQAHPDKEFRVLALPQHKAAKKFSVAEAKIDCRVICEPFRCVCKGEDGKPVVKEYLFETEFANHLNTVHQNKFAYCGYPGCTHRVSSSLMLNHWSMFHGVCTYQCGYCKTSSKDISRIYSHFSQLHPSSQSDILIRVNENLPKDRELGFSKEAFEQLGHIRKVPQNLLSLIGRRGQRSIKLIHFTGSSEESTASSELESTSTGTSSKKPLLTLPVSVAQQPQIIISNPDFQLLVASNTGGSEKLYLVPASMVSPNKEQAVTSTAPISKAVTQTSSASNAAAVGRVGESVLAVEAPPSLPKVTVSAVSSSSSSLPQVPVRTGETSIHPFGTGSSTTTTSSHATIAALSRSFSTTISSGSIGTQRSLLKKAGGKANENVRRVGSPTVKIVSSTVPLVSQAKTITNSMPIEAQSLATKDNEPATDFRDFAEPAIEDMTSQDSSTGLSEDDILQSAIQSILDADDLSESNSNTATDFSNFTTDQLSNISVNNETVKNSNQENEFDKAKGIETSPTASRPSTPEFGAVSKTVPPPLVLISSNGSKQAPASFLEPKDYPSTPTNSSTIQEQNESTPEPVAPVEHIDVTEDVPDNSLLSEDVDPLHLESLEPNDDSNLDTPLFDDINVGLDSPPEDPLTIIPTFNSDLPSADDPLSIVDSEAIADPLEVSEGQESDSANQSLTERSNDPLSIMRRSMSMVSNSDEESDSSSSDKGKKHGLMGYQLYRCISCNLSFSNVQTFKSHLSVALRCKKPGGRQYQCVHCEKTLKTPQRLADHIQTHGVPRFICSLCNEKFTTVSIAKLHMKNRHNIPQTNLIPLKSDRINMDIDEFMVKPGQANQSANRESAFESPKLSVDDNTFNPEQIDSIPIRQIFNTNVKCGKCNYQTKVRVNIVRHLQMHLEEIAVPDIAPVNPVPCLEKNEKMFDKMINLAASSITTSASRMGGANQEKEKEEEKYPEFIPSHRRFVCTARGCSYLCPEEANLKHHLAALHSDDTEFMCAHCKKKIEPADPESVIKHLKLHGLHLYKCHYCSFVHHLKHKVEKHITDGHLDVAVRVVSLRLMESEPLEFGNTQEVSTPPPPTATKFKPWRCCMCKVKCNTKEDIQLHIVHRHDIDTQYKCTLCAFKNDNQYCFQEHFKENHPNHEIDIIFIYQKVEEETPKDDTNATPFDTTPLWQRDKPRIRHIRGILFDEVAPQPTKSPKKPAKTYTGPSSKASSSSNSTTNSNSSTPTSANKNLFDCIDAVARGTAETLQNKIIEIAAVSVKETAKESVASGSSRRSNVGVKEKGGSSGKKEEKKIVVATKGSPATTKDSPAATKDSPAATKDDSSERKEDNRNDDLDDDVVEIKQTTSVIVIDSDESDTESTPATKSDETPKEEEQDDKSKPVSKMRAPKRQGATDLLQEAVKMAKIEEPDDEDSVMATNCSRDHLISIYGPFGVPHNKQWKCPRCKQFKSKRVGDFMFHIYKDFNVYRFKCKACSDLSITYKYMLDHITLHPGFTEDIIEFLPPNVKLETWIHMAIRDQSLAILKNSPLMKKRPITGSTTICCYFCNEKFMSMPDCCEHMLYHWVMMPYQCQHCPNEFYTVYDLKHHHKIEHPDLKLYLDPKGPTLGRALQCIENLKKRPATQSPSRKKAKVDETKDTNEIIEDAEATKIVNSPKRKKVPKASFIPTATAVDVIRIDDDDEDLVIVSKTDDKVPNEDEVFACDTCAYVADTEVLMVKHLLSLHGIKSNKYHSLSKKRAELPNMQEMACNICDEVFSELKLRRHFLANHLESHPFSPYRFKCELCSKRYLTLPKVKMHFTRCHPGLQVKYVSVVSSSSLIAKPSKNRLYSCTMCSYSSISPNSASVRSHLRGHLRPIICNHCMSRFKYLSEVQTHNAKEHPDMQIDFTTLEEVQKEFCEAMKEISNKSTPVLETSPLKNVAKKSTSTLFTPPKTHSDEEEGYSYYGDPPDECDLSNTVTTFELDGLEYTTTAEQMMKMFNMDTYVDVSDCAVDIIPLDKS